VGHVSADHMHVVPVSPRVSRWVAMVQLRGKRTTEGVKVVADALMTGNGSAKTVVARKRK
jgi:hypothetical protein